MLRFFVSFTRFYVAIEYQCRRMKYCRKVHLYNYTSPLILQYKQNFIPTECVRIIIGISVYHVIVNSALVTMDNEFCMPCKLGV